MLRAEGPVVRADQEALNCGVFSIAREKAPSTCPSSLQKKVRFYGWGSDSFPGDSACAKALGQSHLLLCGSFEGANKNRKVGLYTTFLKSRKIRAFKSHLLVALYDHYCLFYKQTIQ